MKDIYEQTTEKLVAELVTFKSSVCLAYGAVGAGKSHIIKASEELCVPRYGRGKPQQSDSYQSGQLETP